EYVVDRVRTLGMAWMGLSIECARCHDHKFDPISQRDYYRFFAFFNNAPELGEAGRVGNAAPFVAAPSREQRGRIADLEARIARLEGEPLVASAAASSRPGAAVRIDCGQRARGRSPLAKPCSPRELAEDEATFEPSDDFSLSLWARPKQLDD